MTYPDTWDSLRARRQLEVMRDLQRELAASGPTAAFHEALRRRAQTTLGASHVRLHWENAPRTKALALAASSGPERPEVPLDGPCFRRVAIPGAGGLRLGSLDAFRPEAPFDQLDELFLESLASLAGVSAGAGEPVAAQPPAPIERMKDEFLAVLSHELRTPINAITGFASFLDDELAGPLNDKQHRHLQRVLHGADRLLELVTDLLEASRLRAGKLQLERRPTNVAELARAVIAALAPVAERKGHRLIEEVPEALPLVEADEAALTMVLRHLLSNALKFTPEGGAVTVSARCEPPFLVVEVADTGPGIPREQLPYLFDRFTQADMSATRTTGGLGLGLTIVKGLIEAHDGMLGVRSEVGRGTTFVVHLPLSGG